MAASVVSKYLRWLVEPWRHDLRFNNQDLRLRASKNQSTSIRSNQQQSQAITFKHTAIKSNKQQSQAIKSNQQAITSNQHQ